MPIPSVLLEWYTYVRMQAHVKDRLFFINIKLTNLQVKTSLIMALGNNEINKPRRAAYILVCM